MDRATARDEAALFASTPGQAISYQIWKLEIPRPSPMPGSGRGSGSGFATFTTSSFASGPASLLRWESLGLRDQVDALERLR